MLPLHAESANAFCLQLCTIRLLQRRVREVPALHVIDLLLRGSIR